MTPQPRNVDRHGFGPTYQRDRAEETEERKEYGPNRVDVHQWIQRHAPKQPRGRIPESIRRPRMRRLMNREREQQDQECGEELTNINALQAT
jgi:hypothetical protein